MNIVHVIDNLDPSFGGPPMVVSRLAAAQAREGHGVALVCYRTPGADDLIREGLAKTPGTDRVRTLFLPAPGRLRRFYDPGVRRPMAELIGAAAVVHLHGLWSPIVLAGARAASAARVPYVLAPHGMLDPWAMGKKTLKKKVGLALGFRGMVNGAACLHALTRYERDGLINGGYHRHVEIIPNGVFLEEFELLPPRGTFYAAHPELSGDPYVLFLSRLHPCKGLDYTADAVAALKGKHPRTRLVVAGPDAGARDALVAQAQSLGITARVHLVGPLWGKDKLAAFVDAACFCLPSESEGFSIAILEALACSKAVVITENCHFPEIAEAGAGLVVPRTVPDVAAALDRVLANPAAAAEMGRAARRLIEANYTWPRVAQRCAQVYAGLSGAQSNAVTPASACATAPRGYGAAPSNGDPHLPAV